MLIMLDRRYHFPIHTSTSAMQAATDNDLGRHCVGVCLK